LQVTSKVPETSKANFPAAPVDCIYSIFLPSPEELQGINLGVGVLIMGSSLPCTFLSSNDAACCDGPKLMTIVNLQMPQMPKGQYDEEEGEWYPDWY
jgi:hypothetical protein